MSESPRYGSSDFGKGGLNDQLDVDDLLDDIGLDRSEIQWRKDFIDFDREDARRLEQYQGVFGTHAEQIAEDFYDNLTDYEQTTDVIGRSEKSVEQLKRTQSAYLVTLASGEYGMDYFRDRARIGKLHDMLEMPMKHYLGQYGVYYDLILPLVGDRLVESLTDQLAETMTDGGTAAGRPAAEASDPPESDVKGTAGLSREHLEATIEEEVDDAIEDILSILRVINLDMQVVADTYIHSYSERLKAAIEENEQLMADVKDEVQHPIEDLQTTSEDVAENAAEITEAANKQTQQVAQIESEISNLSATIEEIASTADQVEDTSERAQDLAIDGQDAATDAVDVMGDIGAAVDGVADDVASLQSRVDQIDDIVEAINDIAEQTNMLALNASIEAARAGEAGDGFAVVANEVKALAEESQEYAGEIEGMVADIQTDTEETVDSLETTTERVNRGVDRVEKAMENLDTIVDAITETAEGISEVADASDDQAASAERLATMADDLVQQAERVAHEVDDLAAANQEQAAMVAEIEDAVSDLSTGEGT